MKRSIAACDGEQNRGRYASGVPARRFAAQYARYYYRFRSPQPGPENTFHTQRAPGSTSTFGVQGDSHPERLGKMYDPDLYVRNLENVRNDRSDF